MKSIKQLFATIILFLSCFFVTSSIYAEQSIIDIDPLTQKTAMSQVNINTASAEELARKLNGIGLSKAKKIVEYRDKFGPFVSIEQLKEVAGIGQSILDSNAERLTL